VQLDWTKFDFGSEAEIDLSFLLITRPRGDIITKFFVLNLTFCFLPNHHLSLCLLTNSSAMRWFLDLKRSVDPAPLLAAVAVDTWPGPLAMHLSLV
jgi:hypothetical protein